MNDHHHGLAYGLFGLAANVSLWIVAHLAQINGFVQLALMGFSGYVTWLGYKKVRGK